MRYDKANVIVGKKTFDNIYIETLKISPDIQVQNVKLINLLSNVVLKDGVNRIHGKKIFKSPVRFSKGIR